MIAKNPPASLLTPSLEDLRQACSLPTPGLAGNQQAEAVLTSSQGITVLCSANAQGAGEHTALLHLAQGGELLWRRDYPLGHGTGHALLRLPDGGFLIAGDVQLSPMEYRGHLLQTGPSGDFIAEASFGPPGVTGFVTACSLPGGSILAGGSASWRGWLLRVDSRLQSPWDAPLGGAGEVTALVSLPAGGFAAAASTETSTTRLGLTRLSFHGADGSSHQQVRLPLSGRGELVALASFPDGSVVGIGHHTADDREPAKLWVVKVDQTGSEVWANFRPAEPDQAQGQRGRAIAAADDGGLFVASDGLQAGRRNAAVQRLDADGTTLWSYSCRQSQADILARGIAATAYGGVVVAGSSATNGGKSAIWILCLDGEGRSLWERVGPEIDAGLVPQQPL